MATTPFNWVGPNYATIKAQTDLGIELNALQAAEDDLLTANRRLLHAMPESPEAYVVRAKWRKIQDRIDEILQKIS